MRFFQAAVLIFGLSSAACAMLDQAGHEQTDIEARVVEANELEALYEADLESRDPAVRPKRPVRPGRDGCKPRNAVCSSDSQCCSNDCHLAGFCE
ncbi:hypothetical protein CGRA01v4_09427 [Colletotrichum graminicola]|nr:hypothetical protein CGRA01v4_09427 [Colletotrichum graminicola]